MIEEIIKALDDVKINHSPSLEQKGEDKKVFNSFEKFNDPDIVGTEEITSFYEILEVLKRELHFDNLFWFNKVILFIINPLNLNSLENITLLEKQTIQKKLLELSKKMYNVYNEKINGENDWWYDDGGFAKRGLIQTSIAIDEMINKYVLHIPHAGTSIPKEFLDDYLLDKDELQNNINQYADFKTDKLYGALLEKCDSVINPYSRLFMDPERFFDDDKEQMQLDHGLGWFYENAILEKKPLRTIKNKEKVAKYYHDHHKKLESLVEEKLELFGECVIIDCHSFSNELYWFLDKELDLPDVGIGFDEFHKDEELIKNIKSCFMNYDIGINRPYSGSIVPNKYYMKDKRVKSVMIEINKKLYLDEDNITVTNQFIPHRYGLGKIAQ